MAKIKGAYFSVDAAGRVGRHMLISRPYGVQVARRIRLAAVAPPPRTPSAAQTARRILYAAACDAWQLLTPEQQQAWQAAGDARAINAFSAYVSAYLLAPPPPTGTTWDGGATTWDGGATTWDVV
jgi:hypothetical protein